MAKYKFNYDVNSDGFIIRLSEIQKKMLFLKKEQAISPTEWLSRQDLMDVVAMARLSQLIENDRVTELPDGSGYLFPHSEIAALNEAQAKGLGLPPAPPFTLNVANQGNLGSPEYKIAARWLENGQTIQTERMGALLQHGRFDYRIPNTFYEIIEAVEEFSQIDATVFDARMEGFSKLRGMLEHSKNSEIGAVFSKGIVDIRIVHATGISLNITGTREEPTFAPMLFGQKAIENLEETGEQLTEDESLLPQRLQKLFANERFSKGDGTKATYVLETGEYVFIDASMRKTLGVIRGIQMSDVDVRKEFLRHPQRVLKEKLLKDADIAGDLEGISALLESEDEDKVEDIVENIFIETKEFSERVVDIGLWEQPILPYLKTDPYDWLPEEFPIKLGGNPVKVTKTDIEPLREKLTDAIDRGETHIQFNDQKIEATKEIVDELDSYITETKPPDYQPPSPPNPDVVSQKEKYVALIRENFEQVSYAPTHGDSQLEEVAFSTPVNITTSLKDHQKDGLHWLQECWGSGYRGCLLADDMGLGKTLQILAFLNWLKITYTLTPGNKNKPILIIAPTTLLKNWEIENQIHFEKPGLGVLTRAFRHELKQFKCGSGTDVSIGRGLLDVDKISEYDWILTTYETLRDYHLSFSKIDFLAVVFDEIQKIKSPAALATRAAKTLKSEFMVGLTGTPVENHMADLWSIMDVIIPGYLGSLKSFTSKIDPKDKTTLSDLHKELLDRQPGNKPQLILRRMKSDQLKGLPQKTAKSYEVKMSSEQQTAYELALTEAQTGKNIMLKTLHLMRGVSLHPSLPKLRNFQNKDDFISNSARLSRTFELLREINKEDEKALIFLESLEMQDIVCELIKQEFKLTHLPRQINGDVLPAKRQALVDEFQSSKGFNVLVLSPRAGGVGLTLTAANHVIHLSRWWNPAVEDQCTDRVYRIGQDKPVFVHFPLAIYPPRPDSSFDKILDKLLTDKRETAQTFLLMPPVDKLADEAVFRNSFSKTLGAEFNFSLTDIDAMGYLQFERWIVGRMADNGWRSFTTPQSGDRGADGIFVNKDTKDTVIVQCKHTANPDSILGDEAIRDLSRAKQNYFYENPRLIAVTNASSFNNDARRLANKIDVSLITREILPQWPNLCF